jgi:hypothetical protein
MLICLLIYMIYPKGGYNPESNFLLGPLWFLTYQSSRVYALAIVVLYVAFVIPVGIRLNTITALVFLLGVVLWIATGIALAMNAVA